MSLLFPEGIDHVADLPYTLHDALLWGLRWLKFDELPEADEHPPKRIWLKPDAMERWWKNVERKRKEKWGIGSGGDDDGDQAENDVSLITRG